MLPSYIASPYPRLNMTFLSLLSSVSHSSLSLLPSFGAVTHQHLLSAWSQSLS